MHRSVGDAATTSGYIQDLGVDVGAMCDLGNTII
jgi:hypothetical protein